ncbi:MAG TPA: ABC transporter permease/substrate-binding protein [Vicinamibacterales bacterium]|nr:ABC transporter permease/substrate-binding protein [Vicinamibacterales bacterium]
MSELVEFLTSHRAELLARLSEHIVLVAVSTFIAAAIGIPLGVLAARRPVLARPLVGLANLAQTIPSLALFGFLIPLPLIGGIGTRTALVALTLYAVLPIVRTTIAGLNGIDRAVLECAVAMGMTPRQMLRTVELPLAAPSILAGVRVATVVGVGTATIASAIGAGGLGDYIFRGLAMVDPVVILAGALPAALLALAADGLLAVASRSLAGHRTSPLNRAAMIVAALALVTVIVASYPSRSTAAVVVGSKNFTEQIILGELLAQTIEQRSGLLVERRFNLGGTLVADEALRRGDIDVYVEYTGTALTALFNEPVGEPASVFDRVRELYADRSITMAAGLGFNNTFAILVRSSAAAERGLARISDLAPIAPEWRAGFGYEFLERPDGFAGLSRTYGLRFRDAPRVMDLNLIYRALAAGEIDVTAGDATSGLIEALDLTPLQDDRAYFPPYDAVPVVRAATLLRYPQLAGALRHLEGRISAEDMRRMNHQVDGLRQDPRDVAHRFLAGVSRGS